MDGLSLALTGLRKGYLLVSVVLVKLGFELVFIPNRGLYISMYVCMYAYTHSRRS